MEAAGGRHAPIEGFTPVQSRLVLESVRVSSPFLISSILITSALKSGSQIIDKS